MNKTSVLYALLSVICIGSADAAVRGNQGSRSAYMQNQRNNYFMITQPDVDTACREKIYKCAFFPLDFGSCVRLAWLPSTRYSRPPEKLVAVRFFYI